jgi:hypothetical protein
MVDDAVQPFDCPEASKSAVLESMRQKTPVDPRWLQPLSPEQFTGAIEQACEQYCLEVQVLSGRQLEEAMRPVLTALPLFDRLRAYWTIFVRRGLLANWTPGVFCVDFAANWRQIQFKSGLCRPDLRGLSVVVVDACGRSPQLHVRSYLLRPDDNGMIGGAEQGLWSRNLLLVPSPKNGGSVEGLSLHRDRQKNCDTGRYSHVLTMLRAMLGRQDYERLGYELEQHQKANRCTLEQSEAALPEICAERAKLARLFCIVGRRRYVFPSLGMAFATKELPDGVLELLQDTEPEDDDSGEKVATHPSGVIGKLGANESTVPFSAKSLPFRKVALSEFADFRSYASRFGTICHKQQQTNGYRRPRALSGIWSPREGVIECVPVDGDCYQVVASDYAQNHFVQSRPQVAAMKPCSGFAPVEELQFYTSDGIRVQISRDDRKRSPAPTGEG